MNEATLREWKCVPPDHLGVPRGGQYGDVDDFIRKAEPCGIYVAWSTWWHRFCLYTMLNGKPSFQMNLIRKDGSPMPMTNELLLVLKHCMERLARAEKGQLRQAFADLAKSAKEKETKQQAADREDIKREVRQDLEVYRRGVKPMIVLPGDINWLRKPNAIYNQQPELVPARDKRVRPRRRRRKHA